jgi:hypothetical protein
LKDKGGTEIEAEKIKQIREELIAVFLLHLFVVGDRGFLPSIHVIVS